MPIVDMQFEDGVFYAGQVGYVSAEDARDWVQALSLHAQHSPDPISVLIDASQATTICNDARKLFAQASGTPNVKVAAVAVDPQHNVRGAQHSRITALLASIRKTHDTHFFDSIEEAAQFVNGYSGQAVYR